MECTTYVQFNFPGIDFAAPHEVENRDLENLKVPPGAIGFRFYDVITVSVNYKGADTFVVSPIGESPHYFFGYLYTPEMLADMVPDSDYLLEQMLEEGWDQVILLTNGAWMPYDPTEEEVLPPHLIGAEMPL